VRPYKLFTPFHNSTRRIVLIGCLAACGFPGASLAVGQEFIPLGNWAYDAIRRFETLGLCVVPDDAPFTRPEFIKLVTEIKEKSFDRRLSERDRYNLERLEKEFTDFASQRDPQARYDPPTFYLEDRPLIFEMDLDVAGIADNEFLDEFGTEYYANSNPTARLHFFDRATYDIRYRLVMGPEHGDRARNQKPSRREKSFKGFTSLYERSYIIVGWDKFHVFYGRDYVKWGPSDWNSLITPGGGISLDQLGWRATLKWFRLSMYNAQLSPASRRHMAAHRLEMLFSGVVIGLSETVIYAGRDWDPVYAFPLSVFYANQFNERGNDDNVYWSADVKVNFLDAVTLYADFLVDDLQFERDGESSDKYALDVGGRLALSFPVATTWLAKYQMVDIYTYTHMDSLTYYVSGEGDVDDGDVLLGGVPGPDSDHWRVEGAFYPRADLVLTLGLFSERRGEGNDLRPFQPGDPVNPKFPSGVVQRTRGWLVRARWELPRNSWIEGSYSRAHVSNLSHVPDLDETTDAFRVVVRVDF
jgi:hypothetical protein